MHSNDFPQQHGQSTGKGFKGDVNILVAWLVAGR
jgi:hypothetical protein